MIYFLGIAIAAAAFAIGLAAGYNLRKKKVPCDSCEYLSLKFEGGYGRSTRYFCAKRMQMFYEPPEYCAHHNTREEQNDGSGTK